MLANSPPGSTLYYSLLYADKDLREKILRARAIYEKLSVIQPAAATWWQQALQTKPEFLPILQAFLHNSLTPFYETSANLDAFYKNTAGAFEKILGNFYGISDPEILSVLENRGIFIEKVNHLCDLKKHVFKNKIYFSGEQLLKHHVTLFDLSQQIQTPAILALLEDEATQLLETFKTFSAIYPAKNNAIRPSVIFSNIQKALLIELQRANFPVFTHHIALTPLRKWWIANRS